MDLRILGLIHALQVKIPHHRDVLCEALDLVENIFERKTYTHPGLVCDLPTRMLTSINAPADDLGYGKGKPQIAGTQGAWKATLARRL
jgi:hypothetical protein